MLFEELRRAIEAAPLHQLDVAVKGMWAALEAGGLSEEQAEQLDTLAGARRRAGRAVRSPTILAGIGAQVVPQAQTAIGPLPPLPPLPPPIRGRGQAGSRPRTDASRQRTRRWVLAGYLPPAIGDTFTQGEAAALSVVAAEAARSGRCTLSISAIAGRAGVGDSTAKRALKRARLLGLLKVEERRVAWNRNDTNVVTVVCKVWLAWLRFRARPEKPSWGGGQNATGTNTGVSSWPSGPNGCPAPALAGHQKPHRQRIAAA